ncbi:MAG TPA: hypothetical protein VFN97_09085 [Actinospica sp.]|nr:hypothetical protein [Actinospica sp.]
MADPDRKVALFRGLVERVLNGQGRAGAPERAAAFGNVRVPTGVAGLVGRVVDAPTLVSAGDFAAGRAAGFSEDQLFEIVVCAAVGAATRRYEAGLAALDEAVLGAEGVG